MKLKKLLALSMASLMAFSVVGCGSSNNASSNNSSDKADNTAADTEKTDDAASDDSASADGIKKYTDIELGKDYTDLTATIKVINHRTDMADADYPGKNWDAYIEEFNKMYPNITVDVETITDYANETLLRLQDENWGDVMGIPAVDKGDLSTYFMSYGTQEDVETQVNYITNWLYQGEVYGVPTTANAQGVVYNKKVFKDAGIEELPKTPDEFIADLKLIKEKTDAIPLYTNYAAEWTMGAWDAYLGGTAYGDPDAMNKMLHTSNPFSDEGTGAGRYNVYKVLYDAVADGLTEDDYTTTDWEGCKGMINNGEIGTMVLGSWAVSQMKAAGDNADDIGYMPFPITVDGKQYASAGADYNFGINVNSSDENKEASLVFVKWMTEKSGFSYNEGGLPIAKGDTNLPDVYADFDGVDFVTDDPAYEGEEDLMNTLNADSELAINAGGNQKVMSIVEHAANGDESFDDIMNEWNEAWTSAQESNSVEINK